MTLTQSRFIIRPSSTEFIGATPPQTAAFRVVGPASGGRTPNKSDLHGSCHSRQETAAWRDNLAKGTKNQEDSSVFALTTIRMRAVLPSPARMSLRSNRITVWQQRSPWRKAPADERRPPSPWSDRPADQPRAISMTWNVPRAGRHTLVPGNHQHRHKRGRG